MIAFAHVDAEGLPITGGKAAVLPDGAVALTEPYTAFDLPRLQWRDGIWEERPKDQPFALAPEEVAAEQAAMAAAQLARAKAQAVERINRRVGDLRRRIFTDIPGQDAIYLEKRAEAVRYVAADAPKDLTDFPLLAGEVGITAPDAWQLAQLWLHLSDAFRAMGAATEHLRQRASAAVAAAQDFDAIEAAEADFTLALTGLSP